MPPVHEHAQPTRSRGLEAAFQKAPLRAAAPTRPAGATKDLAAKGGAPDVAAVAGALTAAPSHDANCPLCASGGHQAGAYRPTERAQAQSGDTSDLQCPGLEPNVVEKTIDKQVEKLGKDAKKEEGGAKKGGDAAKGGDAKKGGAEGKGGGDAKDGKSGDGAPGKSPAGKGDGDAKKSEPTPGGDAKKSKDGGGGGKTDGPPADTKATLAAINKDVAAMVADMLGAAAKHDTLAAGTNSWGNPRGFPGTLGLTTINRAGFVAPVIDFDVQNTPAAGTTAASSTVKFKRTTSTDATHPCTSAPAAENVLGTRAVPDGKGGTVTCDVIFKVTAAYAAKIWAAEDEHLSDLQRAYDISLKKAADEINALSARGFTAATENDAKKAAKDELATKLHAKLGVDHTQYADIVWRLCRLSGSGRDALRYHTFGVNAATTDLANKKIITELNDGATQIGTHSSASVVDLAKL